MADTVQIPGAANAGNDAKRIIAAELEAHRKKEASLPRISEKIQQNEKSSVTRMNAMLSQGRPGHPGVGASKANLDRFAAARRGAMLGGAGKQEPTSPNQRKKSPQKTAGASKSEAEDTENDDSKGPPKAQRGTALHTSLPDIKNHKASEPAAPKKMSQAATGRIGVRYRGRKQARAMQRRRGEGLRSDSRVGVLLAEFNPQEDWVAQTILKHKLASILQANVKGWLIRIKWARNREDLVDNLHKRLEKESADEVHRAKLKEQLAERRAKGGDALAFLTKALQKKPPVLKNPLMAGSKWGKLQTVYNADVNASGRKAEQPTKPARAKEAKEPEPSSSESSEFSDLEMDDIAKVKLRAGTPPWQRIEESLWLGQYNKLGKKSTRAAIEATWDLEQSKTRLEMARERRMARNHEGENTGKGADGEDDHANQRLSSERVRELLYPAYLRKFARMGLLEYNPLDLPASLADQDFEEEESESDMEGEQQDAAVGSRQRKDGKNDPSAQLRPSQDRSPEALAAELGIPVAPKGSLRRGGKAQEAKQEMAAQMEAIMEHERTPQ